MQADTHTHTIPILSYTSVCAGLKEGSTSENASDPTLQAVDPVDFPQPSTRTSCGLRRRRRTHVRAGPRDFQLIASLIAVMNNFPPQQLNGFIKAFHLRQPGLATDALKKNQLRDSFVRGSARPL